MSFRTMDEFRNALHALVNGTRQGKAKKGRTKRARRNMALWTEGDRVYATTPEEMAAFLATQGAKGKPRKKAAPAVVAEAEVATFGFGDGTSRRERRAAEKASGVRLPTRGQGNQIGRALGGYGGYAPQAAGAGIGHAGALGGMGITYEQAQKMVAALTAAGLIPLESNQKDPQKVAQARIIVKALAPSLALPNGWLRRRKSRGLESFTVKDFVRTHGPAELEGRQIFHPKGTLWVRNVTLGRGAQGGLTCHVAVSDGRSTRTVALREIGHLPVDATPSALPNGCVPGGGSIPLAPPVTDWEWGQARPQVNWTAYPQYAYDVFARNNGRARRNGNEAVDSTFVPDRNPTNAGPYTPEIYPYGQGGINGCYVAAKNGKVIPFRKATKARRKAAAARGLTLSGGEEWPVDDRAHALLALQYMSAGFGGAKWRPLYPAMIRKLAQIYPVEEDANRDIWTYYRAHRDEIEEHAGALVPTVAALRHLEERAVANPRRRRRKRRR